MTDSTTQQPIHPQQVDFTNSHAFIIGINDYQHGISPLRSAKNDAEKLANLLVEKHGYIPHIFTESITQEKLYQLFYKTLPARVGENDRVLLYFAGHGVALDGEDGPEGYLVPEDAYPEKRETLLSMREVQTALDQLTCRHLLIILDCCFAGTFRWASTRDVTSFPEEIHLEQYERFVRHPAWQVLTSTAYDQQALDTMVGDKPLGIRELDGSASISSHSPFALALFEALEGAADVVPRDGGDGLITATELYLFLRDQVEKGVSGYHNQTPGLWPLRREFDKGEYVFIDPNGVLNLPPAPELTFDNNPYRGLESYDFKDEHAELFLGRDEEIQTLANHVRTQTFTAVLGASGTGKSSLVKAGLLPHLANQGQEESRASWQVLSPIRPGTTPIANLQNLLADELAEHMSQAQLSKLNTNNAALVEWVTVWKTAVPNTQLLLTVDQLEELVTLCQEAERQQFLTLLAQAMQGHPDTFRLIVTVRTDFEPQFNVDTPLADAWKEARYVVPPMDQADLRQVIEGPAAVRVLYFESDELVNTLINEVIQTPGALPLLSFTLSEMYIQYIKSGRNDRALTKDDYDKLGGVIGSLRTRANEEYDQLDEAHQKTMKRVMLRMIAIGGGELARRRVNETELVYPTEAENQRVKAVLDRLIEARLIVTNQEKGEAIYEPAHDALVLAWDQLLRWRQEAEQYLALQRRLAQAAGEWHRSTTASRAGLLWDDNPRLPQLEETLWPTGRKRVRLFGRVRRARQVLWPNTEAPADTAWLNQVDVAFVQESVQARARFWLRTLRITAVVLIFLLTLTAIASDQRNTAVAEANRANEEAQRSQAQALTSLAVSSLPENRNPFQEEIIQSILMNVHGQMVAQTSSLPISTQLVDEQSRRLMSEIEEKPAIKLLSGHELSVIAVAIDPDGVKLASGDGFINNSGVDSEIRIWNLENLEEEPLVLRGHNDWVVALAFDPSGRWLASGSLDQTIRIWDTEQPDGKPQILYPQDGVGSIAFDPQGRWLASGDHKGKIKLWDFSDLNKEPQELDQSLGSVTSIAFDNSGELLATASGGNQTVNLWNLNDLKAEPQILRDHNSWVSSVAFDPQGRWLASGDYDGEVRLWDLNNLETDPQILIGHVSLVTSVSFHPQGGWLASAGWDSTIRLWDLLEPQTEVKVLRYSGRFTSIAFDPNGFWLASAPEWREVVLWDISRLKIEPQVVNNGGARTAVVFESDEFSLIFGRVRDIEIWEMKNNWWEPSVSFGVPAEITSLAFDPEKQWLFAAHRGSVSFEGESDDGIRLWDLSQPESSPKVLVSHQDIVQSIALDPSGRWLASAGGYQFTSSESDFLIRLWDLSDLDKEPILLDGHAEVVNSVEFDPKGRWLATGSIDSKVLLWDVSNFENEPISLGHEDRDVHSVAFDPDGKYLAAGAGNEIWLWEVNMLDIAPLILTGHESSIQSLEFDPQNQWLASASLDGTARVWDLNGLQSPSIVLEHDNWVNSVAWLDPAVFDSDGYFLATANGNSASEGEILIWRIGGAIQDQFCAMAGRNFTWNEWDEWKSFLGETYRKSCLEYPVHCSVPIEAWPEEYLSERDHCVADSSIAKDD